MVLNASHNICVPPACLGVRSTMLYTCEICKLVPVAVLHVNSNTEVQAFLFFCICVTSIPHKALLDFGKLSSKHFNHNVE